MVYDELPINDHHFSFSLKVKMGSPCANPKETQTIHFAIQFIPQKSTLASLFFLQTWIEYSPYPDIVLYELGIFFFFSTKAYNLACSLQKNTHTSKWKRAMNLLFDLLKTGFRLTALPHTFVWSVYSLIWHSESSETSFIVNVSSKGTFPPHHTTAIQPELSDPFAYYYFSLVGQTSHSAYQN